MAVRSTGRANSAPSGGPAWGLLALAALGGLALARRRFGWSAEAATTDD